MSVTMPVPPAPPQSSFVTVLAWIFIALSGMGVLIAIIENIMVPVMFPPMPPNTNGLPPFASFITTNLKLLLIVALVMAVATLIVSIGLLRRRNWARILFIVALALGIVWSVLGIAFQAVKLGSFDPMLAELPTQPGVPAFRHGFRTMIIAMQIFGSLISIGFIVLYGWLIKRLVSPAIVVEFA
jgi:hypothetical protein